MKRKHIVISGTGRAGTTFLVEVLTYLGMDTGYTVENVRSFINDNSRAGLEHDIRNPDSPYVVKSPWFCDYADEVAESEEIEIEHVLIPVRDLHDAAESRRYVHEQASSEWSLVKRFKNRLKKRTAAGGLWHTGDKSKQEEILLNQLYKLLFSLSDVMVPVTFMRYPRIVRDSHYLYSKIKPVLSGIEYEVFNDVFEKASRPDLVHDFSPKK